MVDGDVYVARPVPHLGVGIVHRQFVGSALGAYGPTIRDGAFWKGKKPGEQVFVFQLG